MRVTHVLFILTCLLLSPANVLCAWGGTGVSSIRWRFETGRAVPEGVTAGLNERVHVACEDGRLYTLDAEGRLTWELDAGTALLSAARVGPDGSVYVGGKDGRLLAIDAGGNLRWTFMTEGPVHASPAVAADGTVYVASTDGRLYALDKNGTELWRFETKGPGVARGAIFASPAIGRDGAMYVAGAYEPNLYALHPADGSVKWVHNFEAPADPCKPSLGNKSGWPFASPVVGQDGTIYQVLLFDPSLYAIDPENGQAVWSVDLVSEETVDEDDGEGWSPPVLGPDGTIYVTLDGPRIWAIDSSGKIKWSARVGDAGGLTLAVSQDGIIYAACAAGTIYALDQNGREVNRMEVGGWPAFPVVLGNGLIVVADTQDYSLLVTDAKNTVWAIEPLQLRRR